MVKGSFSLFGRKSKRLRLKRPKLDIHYHQHKPLAEKLIRERLFYWSNLLNLPVKKVAIRNQKTRWGSCSSRGNLNFNYKIIFLPVCLMDYIIVHELCHLKELNHSKKFWQLVEKQIPNYRDLIRDLKVIERKSRMKPPFLEAHHKCENCLIEDR